MKSNKLFLALLASSALMVSASVAHAQDTTYSDLKPYVAVDFQGLALDLADGFGGAVEDEYGAINIAAGVRPHKNWGVELGYFVSSEEENAAGTLNSRVHGFSADLMGYLPLTDDEKFELLGNIGLGVTTFDVETATVSADETEAKIRFGFGAQYHFSDNWAARARFNFTDAHADGVVDGFGTFGIGVAYKF